MGSAALAVTIAAWRERRPWVGYLRADAHVCLHDDRQHRRSAGRHQDRRDVHRRHRGQLARCPGCCGRRSCACTHVRGRRSGRNSSSPTPPACPCGSSRTGLIPASPEEYEHKLREACESHHLPPEETCCSSRCSRGTPRTSAMCCSVSGVTVDRHRVLRCVSPAIPNAIAALLLYIRDRDRQHSPRLLRVDRRQPDHLPAEVPGVRRRGHGAGDARGAPAGGAGRGAPAPRARGVGSAVQWMSTSNLQLPRLRARGSRRATARPRQSSSGATKPTSGGGQLPNTLSRSAVNSLEVGGWELGADTAAFPSRC